MKLSVFFYLCMLIGPAIAQSQQGAKPKNIMQLEGSMGTFKGTLLAVNDSSLTVLNHLEPNAAPVTIPFNEIAHIKIRKRNKVANGLAIGMAVGGISGFFISKAAYEPPPTPVQVLLPESRSTGAWTIVGLLGGGLLGTLIGSSKVHLPINGHYPSFAAASGKLQKYTHTL